VNRFVSHVVLMSLAIVSGSASANAMTSDQQWACEIVLCMANPAGPTAAASCKPPIEKMYREMAKGNAVPSCQFTSTVGASGGPGGGSGGSSGGKDRPAQQER